MTVQQCKNTVDEIVSFTQTNAPVLVSPPNSNLESKRGLLEMKSAPQVPNNIVEISTSRSMVSYVKNPMLIAQDLQNMVPTIIDVFSKPIPQEQLN